MIRYFVNVKKQPNGVMIFEVVNVMTLQVVFTTNIFAQAHAKCEELNFFKGSKKW